MGDECLETLRAATAGLLFPSETDAPFEPFVWVAGENTPAVVSRFAGYPPAEPCLAMSLEEFLRDLNDDPPFRALKTILEKTLKAIRVYRFGTTAPVYYLVGQDSAGRLAGLKTNAVET